MLLRSTDPIAAMLFAFLCLGPVALGQALEHPRLFISPADIPRLRHLCGTSAPESAIAGHGPHGSRAADFGALRMRMAQEFADVMLPGEIAAAAFLHLVAPSDPGDRARLDLIADALNNPPPFGPDRIELALAMDWCWADLSYTARQEFLTSMQQHAQLLQPGDSPLDHARFKEKLVTLMVAVAVDEEDFRSPSWDELRTRVLAAARAYATSTLPRYIEWRGRIPTSPAVAAQEEGDTAILIELLSQVTGRDLWQEHRESVGRWLEHYVLATLPHPALRGPFLRDDGDGGSSTPAAEFAELLPVTAHLIAARTGDPSAATVADDVAGDLGRLDHPGAMLWRWVPIVFELRDIARCDTGRLPPARNLDGAVVFRGGGGPRAAAIWIDTGQPFLRRGQHFDAGHFLIRAGGMLTVDAGADVALEAVSAKGGEQRLGREPDRFRFAQISAASIAHNCMIFADAARVPRWHGQQFLPAGGQRPQEDTCDDFQTALVDQHRQTGRLAAYGQSGSASYAAVDLAPAYDSRTVARYTREFLFLWQRVLVIVDRFEPGNPRVTPVWVVQIPDSPTVNDRALPQSAQIQGLEPDRGVWRLDPDSWLQWGDRDGKLAMRSLAPSARLLNVVGGPADRELIPEGNFKGRTYVGGGADTFERLIKPSSRANSDNAWFRLGSPTQLGSGFADQRLWGRVEIEGQPAASANMFVTVLVINPDAGALPDLALSSRAEMTELRLANGPRSATFSFPVDQEYGGVVEFAGDEARWVLPTEVERDDPLVGR